jgi:hypothetical protein
MASRRTAGVFETTPAVVQCAVRTLCIVAGDRSPAVSWSLQRRPIGGNEDDFIHHSATCVVHLKLDAWVVKLRPVVAKTAESQHGSEGHVPRSPPA